MSAQTTYDLYARIGVEGMIARNSDSEVANKGALEVIPFGRAVVRGTSDETTRLPVDTNSKFIGVALHIHALENPVGGEVSSYAVKEVVSVLRRGQVYVKTEQAVVPGDPVYFRFAGTGDKGAFRKDADTANAKLIPGATFETTADANGLAVIRIYGGL